MWEKIYWGFGAAGLSLLIVPRIRQYFRKDDAEVRCWRAARQGGGLPPLLDSWWHS